MRGTGEFVAAGNLPPVANAHATNPLQSESVKLRPRPVNADTATVDIVTLKTIGTRSGCQTWEGSYQLLQSRGRWLIDDARITPTSC